MHARALSQSLQFLDSWLDFRRQSLNLPGLMVAIAHKGDILFNKAYGYANLETREKLTPRHLYYIASQSKTFTATAIMQLAEQGKLTIDDRVVDFLPWLKKHKDKRFLKITIRQLMSHSAGVIKDGLDANFWSLERPFPDVQQFQREILKAGLVLDPNTRMNYSNFGFGLLGMVVEAAAEAPYAEYVQENIIERLGLKTTSPAYVPNISSKLATGYSLPEVNDKRIPIAKNLDARALSPATGFYASIEDLCSYYSAHLVGSKRLLSDDSKREMQRCQWVRIAGHPRREYGLGFSIEYLGKKPLFGHQGWMHGYSSHTLCDPAKQLVVSLFTNSIAFETRLAVMGIHSVLEFFQDNSSTVDHTRVYKRFRGRYANLWGLTEIVTAGKKIVAIDPDQWQPFDTCSTLEYVDSKSLKAIDAPGDCETGYFVHYKFSKAGTTEFIT